MPESSEGCPSNTNAGVKRGVLACRNGILGDNYNDDDDLGKGGEKTDDDKPPENMCDVSPSERTLAFNSDNSGIEKHVDDSIEKADIGCNMGLFDLLNKKEGVKLQDMSKEDSKESKGVGLTKWFDSSASGHLPAIMIGKTFSLSDVLLSELGIEQLEMITESSDISSVARERSTSHIALERVDSNLTGLTPMGFPEKTAATSANVSGSENDSEETIVCNTNKATMSMGYDSEETIVCNTNKATMSMKTTHTVSYGYRISSSINSHGLFEKPLPAVINSSVSSPLSHDMHCIQYSNFELENTSSAFRNYSTTQNFVGNSDPLNSRIASNDSQHVDQDTQMVLNNFKENTKTSLMTDDMSKNNPCIKPDNVYSKMDEDMKGLPQSNSQSEILSPLLDIIDISSDSDCFSQSSFIDVVNFTDESNLSSPSSPSSVSLPRCEIDASFESISSSEWKMYLTDNNPVIKDTDQTSSISNRTELDDKNSDTNKQTSEMLANMACDTEEQVHICTEEFTSMSWAYSDISDNETATKGLPYTCEYSDISSDENCYHKFASDTKNCISINEKKQSFIKFDEKAQNENPFEVGGKISPMDRGTNRCANKNIDIGIQEKLHGTRDVHCNVLKVDNAEKSCIKPIGYVLHEERNHASDIIKPGTKIETVHTHENVSCDINRLTKLEYVQKIEMKYCNDITANNDSFQNISTQSSVLSEEESVDTKHFPNMDKESRMAHRNSQQMEYVNEQTVEHSNCRAQHQNKSIHHHDHKDCMPNVSHDYRKIDKMENRTDPEPGCLRVNEICAIENDNDSHKVSDTELRHTESSKILSNSELCLTELDNVVSDTSHSQNDCNCTVKSNAEDNNDKVTDINVCKIKCTDSSTFSGESIVSESSQNDARQVENVQRLAEEMIQTQSCDKAMLSDPDHVDSLSDSDDPSCHESMGNLTSKGDCDGTESNQSTTESLNNNNDRYLDEMIGIGSDINSLDNVSVYEHVGNASVMDQWNKNTKAVEPCKTDIPTLQRKKKRVRPLHKQTKCKFCGEKFQYTWHLLSHLVVKHRQTKPYKCPVCRVHLRNKFGVNFHKLLHKGQKSIVYQCSKCQKSFPWKQSLKRHMSTHSSDRPFSCDFCKQSFKTNHTLCGHKKTHQGLSFPCAVCEKSFSTKSQCKSHSIIHNKDFRYTCSKCDRKFIRNQELKLHQAVHTEDRPYNCSECLQSFKTKRNLRMHKQSHSTERYYCCDLCKKRFKSNDHLKRHTKSVHSNVRPYACEVCDQRFKRKDDVMVHKSKHSTDRPFSCDVCNQNFKTKQTLHSHTQNCHSKKIRPYSCSKCYMSFRKQSDVIRHYKLHTSEYIHPCLICDKRFKSQAMVEKHMKCHSSERPFKCEICEKSFKSKSDVKSHAQVHVTERAFSCFACGSHVKTQETLRRHKLVCEKVQGISRRQFECVLCLKPFKTESSLKAHMKRHETNENMKDTDTTVTCSQCTKSFENKASLTYHQKCHKPNMEMKTKNEDDKNHKPNMEMKTKNEDDKTHIKSQSAHRPFECMQCMKSFKSESKLRMHIDTHDTSKEYQCVQCLKSFRTKLFCERHEKTHSTDYNISCLLCEKKFVTKDSFKKHMDYWHHEKKRFECTICKKDFRNKIARDNHEIATCKKTNRFECLICMRSFPYENGLRTHMILHTGERNYACSTCNETFSYSTALSYHIKSVHTHEKLYECTICHQMCINTGALKTHMRIHSGEKPYACKLCPKRFAQQPHLTTHMRWHKGIRPFICKECGKSFTQSSHLRTHWRGIHSGEKPYKCSECNHAFALKTSLKSHMRVHTGEKPYRCAICPEAYSQLHCLKLHSTLTGHVTPGINQLKPLHCSHCERVFYYSTQLRYHKKTCDKRN